MNFIDDKREGVHESTKYAFDVLSILLGDSMPKPKEVPIKLQLSYEELFKIEDNTDNENVDQEEKGEESRKQSSVSKKGA